MPAVEEVRAPARTGDGAIRGYLRIALLPQANRIDPAPLLDTGSDIAVDESLTPVQLLEGYEYRYQWEELPGFATTVATDPEEAFQPDTADGLKGRLRPGLSTGTMQVLGRCGEVILGQLELEVRSRKLTYLSEYRWMLRDIADEMTELVMERFAVSKANFTHAGTRDAVTLYQRFAFLQALIDDYSFQSALNEIKRRPHVAWEERQETAVPGQPLKATAYTIRQLCSAGARAAWPGGPIKSIPLHLDRRRTEATHDTTPNRFVRFALERWRQVVGDIGQGLAAAPSTAAVARGRREVVQTLEHLDAVLHHDLFKDLGELTRFPADDQVLQRREGYRDVFRAYLEFELAAQLSWRGAEATYSAGQRDVATLYEYWAFIQLAKLISGLAGLSFDLRALVQVRSDGLNIVLQTGKETVLSGIVERPGRRMAIELWFNRTFGRGMTPVGSWTRPMRPDYSLIIYAPSDEPAGFEPVVLHFDAKYRVAVIAQLFGQEEVVAEADGAALVRDGLARGGALRADLLKMHAYRDAIRRSAGAYVLYPGDDHPEKRGQYSEYHELLPGLGAFVLRPTQSGEANGIATLRTFLEEVFEHVATRLTRHERGRYWLEEVYAPYELGAPRPSSAFPGRPGPDTTVLLGYVKNAAHWKWIQETKTYNVRTQDRPGGVAPNAETLFCQLLLLYCPESRRVGLARIVSDPELVERAAMKSTGYPDPTSDYLCVQFSWVSGQWCVASFSAAQIDQFVRQLGKLRGEPTAVRWADLEKVCLN